MYLAREGKSVSKTFKGEAEAKTWRSDALAAAAGGSSCNRRGERHADAGCGAAGVRGGHEDGSGAAPQRAALQAQHDPLLRAGREVHIAPSPGRAHSRSPRFGGAMSRALADHLLASGLTAATR